MTYKGVSQVIVTLAFLLLTASVATGQCPVSVLTTNLKAPTKVIISTKGKLFVAEEGNGVNTGRISIVDPASGDRRTLLDGLPSGFAAPNNDPSGLSGLAIRGLKMRKRRDRDLHRQSREDSMPKVRSTKSHKLKR